MRNPNRLNNLYDELKNIHKTYLPDWRFGQFMINFINWYYNKYKRDIFYIEDDKILTYIKEYINEFN